MMQPPGGQLDAAALESRIDDAAGRSRHDPEGARSELVELVRLADSAGLASTTARACYALARVLVSLGSAESALLFIERAEQTFRSVGQPDEAIRTNLGRMHVLDELGRYGEAVEVGRSVQAELRDGDDAEIVWLRAAVEENTGVALGYLGRHEEALDAYASAAMSYERLGLVADAARLVANRGVELNELARPAAAIEALEQAYTQFVAVGDRLWQALCQTNLSEAWISAGRYLEAFQCLDVAESALDGLERTTEWMRAQLARASCLESLHLDIEALDLYDELVDPLTEAGLLGDLGKVQLGRGTILVRSHGSADEALAAFEAAVDAFEVCGDDPMLARAHLAAAPLDADPAARIERAIALTRESDRPADRARALLAETEHFERSDTARAAASLRSARELVDPLGVPALQWRIHHRTGRLLRLMGQSAGAQSEFEAALAILESIRSSVDRDGIRQRFDGALSEAGDDLVELLLDNGDAATASAFSESIRMRGLFERLAGRRADSVPAPPDELLSVYDRLMAARGPQAAALAGRARVLERRASARRDVAAPAVALPPRPDRDQVVFQLVGDEIVLFLGDDDGGVTAMRKIGERSVVERLLRQLDRQWRTFEHPEIAARHAERLQRATIAVLRRLHETLIAPIDDRLPAGRPLTVVADGPLAAVPFAALHDGRAHLVEHRAVRQTPSLAIDAHLRERHRPIGSVLAIGTDDEMAPRAAVEAGRIGEMWGRSTVRVGAAADTSALFDLAADHDVIHIAAHGLFRPDAPEFSAVRFADRWVTAAEIAQLRLDGQLIVLSTCDSGRRTLNVNVRETLGLPRAFLGAGAGGVVVNLWPADDRATARLMTRLHSGLRDGGRLVDALRSAQLDTISHHPHPYYWGGTTLIGRHDPVPAARARSS